MNIMAKLLNSGSGEAREVEPLPSTEVHRRAADLEAELAAVNRSFARICFTPEGIILDANANFLAAVEYKLEEVVGEHHRMFVDPAESSSTEYQQFWRTLKRGESQDKRFRRLTKTGREIYIQASYMPLKDETGQVYKVVKYATDITDEVRKESIDQAKLAAISRAQAVIEFDETGVIRDANDNFLQATGYRIEEIRGQHHRLFVEPAYAESSDYASFWRTLGKGEFSSGRFKRVTKAGNALWLEASYNPIYDTEGRLQGVVKFATDITQMVEIAEQSKEVGQSVAVSVTQMDATISEIASNLSRTVQLAGETETKSAETNDFAQRLSESSEVIERIVDTIRDLAGQTHLLALNATIESARAGDAGKGFSVVASEVKELARQTTDATSSIVKSVETIKGSISEVAGAAATINQSISEVTSSMTNISAALEEQSATSRDMKHRAEELVQYLA